MTAPDIGLEHAQPALHERGHWDRLFVDGVPELLWSCAPDGFALDHNRSWFDYTGQSSDQARGLGWLDALHPEDRDAARQWWRENGATARSYRAEYRLRRAKDGQYRRHQTHAEPKLDARGRIVCWFGSC